MRILSIDNKSLELSTLLDENEIRYSILDNTTPSEPDFFFPSLLFLETFTSPAIALKIGDNKITLPIDWCIAVGDSMTSTAIEVLPLSSLNDRGFEALIFNPLSGYRLEFKVVEILDYYNDFTWYFPKMRPGQLLTFPLSANDNPDCIYAVKEVVKQYELIQLDKLI